MLLFTPVSAQEKFDFDKLTAQGQRLAGYCKDHPNTDIITAADMARVLRHYLTAWRKNKVMIAGYSFGADVAGFVANGLPDDLKPRIGELRVSQFVALRFAAEPLSLSEPLREDGDAELGEMLTTLKLSSLDELIKQTVPAQILNNKGLDLGESMTEAATLEKALQDTPKAHE